MLEKIEYSYYLYNDKNIKKFIFNERISRIYIGDQECDYNFISIIKNKVFFNDVLDLGKKITFLLPRFNDTNLDFFVDFLDINKGLLNTVNELEFSINDYFLIDLIGKYIPKATYVAGVYINNQVRDPETTVESYIKGDYDIYDAYYKEKKISGLDLFNSKNDIKISNITLGLNIFYPYIVHGFSRYCYNKHLEDNIKNLCVIDKCSGCKSGFTLKAKMGEENLYYKNNKYLSENFSKKNFFDKNLLIKRIIYNYDLL